MSVSKSTLKIGDKAPDFTLPTDGAGSVTLSALKGQPVVLYFYPKDDTSGCTQEACDFRDNLSALKKLKAQVIGVSKDSVKKHDKFKEKYELNFPLASDEDGAVCDQHGVWVEKSMYGRKYMGIERSTFLIGADGKIAQIWRKVSVTDHVQEVMAALKPLAKAS
ncbi:MAG TPA: thioredoxin-dependent thiol peroxidase [Micavibrio sp.]